MLKVVQDKIWDKYSNEQSLIIRGIVKNIRGYADNLEETITRDFIGDKMFFVPNSDLLPSVVGEWIRDSKWGIYTPDGKCKLAGRLAIPLRTLDNSVIGFVGYTKEDKDSDGDYVKYLYPPSSVFDKSKYFYMDPSDWILAYKEQVVVIVDGIFDKRMLSMLGIPAVSLCGSDLSIYHELYLRRISRKIILHDNDAAGVKLAKTCQKKLGAIPWTIKGNFKDIDSVIATGEYNQLLLDTWNEMREGGFLLSKSLKV